MPVGTAPSAAGEIILRLPYDASLQNVILSESQDMPEINGHEVHWSFTELEPTPQDNLTFEIVKPSIWMQVLDASGRISQNGQDGEAYGLLGEAYKQAFFAAPKSYPRDDAGAAPLLQWSRAAYERAVALDPENAQWHAGFAELLLENHFWTHFQDTTYTSDLHRGLQELAIASRMAPDDPTVVEMLERFFYAYPDYITTRSIGLPIFTSLTQTPSSFATDTPNPAPVATLPFDTRVESTDRGSGGLSGLPICGGVALLFVPLGILAWKSRKRI